MNGRLEKRRVVLYFSSSRIKSALSLATSSSLRVPLGDALEEPKEEWGVVHASEAEVGCRFKGPLFDLNAGDVSSRPEIFAPGITRAGMYSWSGHVTFATTRPKILKASRQDMSLSRIRQQCFIPAGTGKHVVALPFSPLLLV